MYKIYFGENLVTFPPSLPPEGYTVVTDPTPERIRALIEDCYGKGSAKIALFSSAGQDLAKIFDGFFRSIEAAGGVVRHRDTGKILMIRRWGRWDLPKGWKEPGETDRENALREVSEETGIARLEIERYIDTSHHAYILDGKWALKHTHWYAMSTRELPTVPQAEEGIEEARWLDAEEVTQTLIDTYPNIRETMELYLEKYAL